MYDLTDGRVAALAAAGESEVMEYESTTGTRREAARTVAAMLNDRGGHILFGVTPDGRVTGQQVSERTLEELAAELRRMDPPAFPALDRVPVGEGREVIVVNVGHGPAKPYQYRGIAYRRPNNTTVAMPADEYNRVLFERLHSERRWENQLAEGWSVGNLDAAEIRRTVEEAVRRRRLEDPGSRGPAELLRGLGLFRDESLSRAAVVLSGEPRRLEFELPQCLLRVARFRGIDRTEFTDNCQFQGNTFQLLRVAEQFLRETLPIASRVEPDRLKRIDVPLYPVLALREALANAFCHRNYSPGGGSVGVAVNDDRLEITSSGRLHS